VFIKELKIL